MLRTSVSPLLYVSAVVLHFCLIAPDAAGQVRHLYPSHGESLQPGEWRGKWIWLPGVSNQERNHMMLARKTFALSSKPDKAYLYITADSHYKLWINGVFVASDLKLLGPSPPV